MSNNLIMKQRSNNIDILKFIATILIFNHLAQRFYGHYSYLATGGALGCAIFFFCSGYTNALRELRKFDEYVKRRLMRLWPTCIVACLILEILGRNCGVMRAISGAGWFVQCLFIYYIAYYFIVKLLGIKGGGVHFLLVIVIVIPLCLYSLSNNPVSLYGNTYLKYLIFYLFFMMGVLVSKRKQSSVIGIKASLILMIASIVGFYAIIVYSSHFLWMQVLSVIPLMGFVFFLNEVSASVGYSFIYSKPLVKNSVLAIGGLSLEMYLCGSIASKFVPANMPVLSYGIGLVSSLILSYFVRCGARLFAQTFTCGKDSSAYNLKEAIKLW